jgi:hypothetical protein
MKLLAAVFLVLIPLLSTGCAKVILDHSRVVLWAELPGIFGSSATSTYVLQEVIMREL